MKSFINFLLEGQAEIDSAIQRMGDIDTGRDRLWAAASRLERILNQRTKPQELEHPYEKSSREFQNFFDTRRFFDKKLDKKFKPQVKNLMRSLSPEDLRGFLMTPDTEMNEIIAKSNAYATQHYAGMGHVPVPQPTNKVLLDKFLSSSWNQFVKMVPPDALKDTSDLLSVVRFNDNTSKEVADMLNKNPKLPFMTADQSETGKPSGGTFRERKAERKRMRGNG